jgi:hypothetical protein
MEYSQVLERTGKYFAQEDRKSQPITKGSKLFHNRTLLNLSYCPSLMPSSIFDRNYRAKAATMAPRRPAAEAPISRLRRLAAPVLFAPFALKLAVELSEDPESESILVNVSIPSRTQILRRVTYCWSWSC